MAGSGAGTSASGLAAGPRKQQQQLQSQENLHSVLKLLITSLQAFDYKADGSLKPEREAQHLDQQQDKSRYQKFR